MFYARYVALCSDRNISPSKVALECGFNKGSVSIWKKKYEKGEDVKPTSEILIKIADYFNVSVDYLLGNESKAPNAEQPATESQIKFALFGGDEDITDEMLDEVKAFAQFVKNKYKKD